MTREMSRYRPWGLLDWLLPKTSVQSWSLLACIGTEERSLVAWETLRRLGVLGFASFVRLLPHGHNRFSQQTAQLFQQRLAEFRALGGRDQDVSEIELLVRYGDIVDFVDRFLARGHSSVALDLSVLPKRFFFPFVRRIMDRRPAVENFVAIYTRPQKYTEGPLSENPAEWDGTRPWSHSWERRLSSGCVIAWPASETRRSSPPIILGSCHSWVCPASPTLTRPVEPRADSTPR